MAVGFIGFFRLDFHKVMDSFNRNHPGLKVGPTESQGGDVVVEVEGVGEEESDQGWLHSGVDHGKHDGDDADCETEEG